MTPYQLFAVCLFFAHIADSMTVNVAELMVLGEATLLCQVDPDAFATLGLAWAGIHRDGFGR